MAHLSARFSLDQINDQHDIKRLKQGLDALPGVTSVSGSDSGSLAVDYDSTGTRQEDIRKKIQELGFSSRDTEEKNT